MVRKEAEGRAVIQLPDWDFDILLERVAMLTPQQVQALRFVYAADRWVDVRRIARHIGTSTTPCTEAMRALMCAGFVQKDGQKWRFAFRGARKI